MTTTLAIPEEIAAQPLNALDQLARLPKTDKSDLATKQRDFTPYDNSGFFREELVRFRKILFSSQPFEDLLISWEK